MFNTICTGARISLLAVLAVFTQSALALGLGNIAVESYLNQPLQARIDLITRADDDLGTLTVDMASADDFALIGASREAISVPLGFAVERTENGASIVVTSELPVKDPVIRLIVEVKWANGRLLREYTMFLDPPAFASTAPSPVIDERGRPAVKPAPADAQWVQSDQSKQPPGTSTVTQAGTSRLSGVGTQYGPVQRGDTLWQIAANWSQGTGLDMSSVMLEIQRANPEAFINDNINLLKRGAILRMPQVDDVSRRSVEAARAEVRQQNQMYSQQLTQPAATPPMRDSNSQPLSGTDDRSSGVTQRDQLELVPPAENVNVADASGIEESVADSGASTAVQALREDLARKEEELVVERQQNQYLADQITELKTRLQAAQDGNVPDAALSQMENRLREERLSGETAASGESQSASEPTQTESRPARQPRQAEVPRVSTSDTSKAVKHWYSRPISWLLTLLVLAAAVAGWWFMRRQTVHYAEPEILPRRGGTIREIKDEAEEVLQVLKTDRKTAKGDRAEETAGVPTASAEPKTRMSAGMARQDEEAEILDMDSADPEVRLDLARAYISMGDREAARVILEEVVEQGMEEQQAEARKMLNNL